MLIPLNNDFTLFTAIEIGHSFTKSHCRHCINNQYCIKSQYLRCFSNFAISFLQQNKQQEKYIYDHNDFHLVSQLKSDKFKGDDECLHQATTADVTFILRFRHLSPHVVLATAVFFCRTKYRYHMLLLRYSIYCLHVCILNI